MIKFSVECLVLSLVIVIGLLGAKYTIEKVLEKNEIPTYEIKTIR